MGISMGFRSRIKVLLFAAIVAGSTGCETMSTSVHQQPPVTSEYPQENKWGRQARIYEHRAAPEAIARYCERHYDGMMCARWGGSLDWCHIYLYANATGDAWKPHELKHCRLGDFHP